MERRHKPFSIRPKKARRPAGRRLAPPPAARRATEKRIPAASVKPKKATIAGEFSLPVSITLPQLLDDRTRTDHRFRQLLHDFFTLGASLEVARAHLASVLGLTSPQYSMAMVLAGLQNSGGVSVSEVARRLHVSTAFVTSEANKLEHAGLVAKRPNPRDGRGVLLCLTARGEALVQRVGPERQHVNNRLFANLSKSDFRQLSRILSALLDDFVRTSGLLQHGMFDES